MNSEDDALSQEDTLKNLLQHIRENSSQLSTVMWSQEELITNKDYLNTVNHKINDMIDLIVRNLYWYQKIGWKKFLGDRETVEKMNIEEGIANEKHRFEDWLAHLMTFSDFYLSFHDEVPDSTVTEKLSAQGMQDMQRLRILDIGCRNGLWLRKFLNLGVPPENLCGIDFYEPILDEARQLCGTNLQLIKAYPDTLPFEDHQFDLVLIFGVLMHVLDESLQRRIGKEVYRLTSNNGMVIMVNLSKNSLLRLDPYLAYTSQIFGRDELAGIFTNCQIKMEEDDKYSVAVITKKNFSEEN